MNKIFNFFFPTDENKLKPGILQSKLILALLIIFIFFQLLAIWVEANTPINASDITVQNVLSAINNERGLRNLPTLQTDERLSSAAGAKSDDMIARKYFSHTDPEGNYIWPKIVAAGYNPYKTLGENLAIEFTNTESMVQAWMNSPTHRANIVNENFLDQGMGVAFGNVSQGQYFSAVTNTFGAIQIKKPAPVQVAQQAPKPASQPAPEPVKETPVLAAKPLPEKPKSQTITEIPPKAEPEKQQTQPKTEITKSAPPTIQNATSAALTIISPTLQIQGEMAGESIHVTLSIFITGNPSLVTAHVGGGKWELAATLEALEARAYSGELTIPYAPGINEQSIKILAQDSKGGEAAYEFPLRKISFGRSEYTTQQILDAWAKQQELATSTPDQLTFSGGSGLRPNFKSDSLQLFFKYNRYISLGFGILFLLLMLTDINLVVEKKLQRFDKRAGNMFVLLLSLIIIALMYWL